MSFTPDLSTEMQYEKQIGTLQQQDHRIQELEAENESLKTMCEFKVKVYKIRSADSRFEISVLVKCLVQEQKLSRCSRSHDATSDI